MNANLSAKPRTRHGKSAARALRREGRVPAAISGHNEASRSLSLDRLELQRLLTNINVENTLISLTVDGEPGAEPRRVLVRELQTHPFRADVLHVDFYQVTAGETLTVEIPVRLTGNPVGVREEGGVLHEDLREVEVECLPRDIPELVEIDVSALAVGDSIHIRDLQIPNVRILNDPDVAICSIVLPRAAIEEVESAELEPGIGAVEPELVGENEADEVPATEQG